MGSSDTEEVESSCNSCVFENTDFSCSVCESINTNTYKSDCLACIDNFVNNGEC